MIWWQTRSVPLPVPASTSSEQNMDVRYVNSSCAASATQVSNAAKCYCGKNFASSGPTVELECSADCPGDATQKCGGNRRLTTYAIPGILTPLEPLPYKSLGCYTESTTGRALAGGSTASDSMTVQKCAEYCIGFSMFGLEYSRECFCGYMLGAGSVKAPEAQCSNVCSGSAEICGGPSRLSVYTNNL